MEDDGTRLGFATVYGIVAEHSGVIKVDTGPDRGRRILRVTTGQAFRMNERMPTVLAVDDELVKSRSS